MFDTGTNKPQSPPGLVTTAAMKVSIYNVYESIFLLHIGGYTHFDTVLFSFNGTQNPTQSCTFL